MREPRPPFWNVLGVAAALWTIGLLGALSSGFLPETARGWVFFLILAPPVALAAEWFFAVVTDHGRDQGGGRWSSSFQSIAWLLLLLGVVVAGLVGRL